LLWVVFFWWVKKKLWESFFGGPIVCTLRPSTLLTLRETQFPSKMSNVFSCARQLCPSGRLKVAPTTDAWSSFQ
jgi:hypothetical protein